MKSILRSTVEVLLKISPFLHVASQTTSLPHKLPKLRSSGKEISWALESLTDRTVSSLVWCHVQPTSDFRFGRSIKPVFVSMKQRKCFKKWHLSYLSIENDVENLLDAFRSLK